MEGTGKIEAISILRSQNDSLCGELMRDKQKELSCQRCKEALLKKKKMTTTATERRQAAVADVLMEIPNSSRKLFDQLHCYTDDIYQLELLLLELNQQLMDAKATREEKTILKALRSVPWQGSNEPEGNWSDDPCLLTNWFHQISHVETALNPDACMLPVMASQPEGSMNRDRVFYWAKCEEVSSSDLCRHQALTFSTRHCGIVLRLCVTAVIRRREDGLQCDATAYTVTSDLPLEGLQQGLQRSVHEEHMAHEFVLKTVWRLMEDQLAPLMSR